MASTLKFHGIANLKAILMVLRARVNSPMSRMSSEKLSLTVADLEAALEAQLLMLNNLMDILLLWGLWSSIHPLEETWPAKPTAPMS